jgi:hypothetical protein
MKLFPISIAGLFCFAFIQNNAQPVLTQSLYDPHPGDLYMFGSSSSYAPSSGGANQVWDFSADSSNITANDTFIVDPASAIPCSNSYPGATMGITNAGDYSMINISATEYNYYGNTVTPGQAGWVYSDPRKELVFPMNYTDTFTDSYYGENYFGGVTGYQYGTVTVTYDGYGTVITPYGTWTNVSRIYTHFVMTDSSNNGGCSGSWDQYTWYAPTERYPVAKMWFPAPMNVCFFPFGTWYLQNSVTGLRERTNGRELSVFPNPFSEKTTIRTNKQLENAELYVYNSFGQLVGELKGISGKEISLERGQLANGLYLIQLMQDGQQLSCNRILINK